MNLSDTQKQWTDETWAKITEKMDWLHKSKVEAQHEEHYFGWTSGFWLGMHWLMYYGTQEESYRKAVEALEKEQSKALAVPEKLHHDVGFMWELSSVAGYRLSQNKDMRQRGLIVANYLLSRFQHKGGYIIAWNGNDREAWSIIDTMMNLPLLFWASEETGLSRYRDAAIAHADKTLANMVRDDGSVCHIAVYNPQTGEKVEELGGQGYAVGSSWSRGTSWAVYGFAIAYRYTKDPRYLNAAKRIAHYFLHGLGDDAIPRLDFRQPAEPDYRDSSAGAITACGLLEIVKHVGEYEKADYLRSAMRILQGLEPACCDWTRDNEAILLHGCTAYFWGTDKEKDTHLIYGDYFFIEAILTLRGMDISLW